MAIRIIVYKNMYLSFSDHISALSKSCYCSVFQLCCICTYLYLCTCIYFEAVIVTDMSIVHSKFDYCNSPNHSELSRLCCHSSRDAKSLFFSWDF